MYAVHQTNLGGVYEPKCGTLWEAIALGRSKGFEFTVYDAEGRRVGVGEGVYLNYRSIQ
jgi:hypothetical protein